MGAPYREATRTRSTAEFVSKIEGGRQELEATMCWLEVLGNSEVMNAQPATAGALVPLHAETNELMAMRTACARNAKGRKESL